MGPHHATPLPLGFPPPPRGPTDRTLVRHVGLPTFYFLLPTSDVLRSYAGRTGNSAPPEPHPSLVRAATGLRDGVPDLIGKEAYNAVVWRAMLPLWSVTSVAFILTLLPVMVTHWLPGVIIGFPFVLALVLLYAAVYLMFRLIITKGFEPSAGRDLPAGVVLLVTVLHRGAFMLFVILLFQGPVTWSILFYDDGDYYLGHSGAKYGQLVADDMNRRSVICYYFGAYNSAAGGINAVFSLV